MGTKPERRLKPAKRQVGRSARAARLIPAGISFKAKIPASSGKLAALKNHNGANVRLLNEHASVYFEQKPMAGNFQQPWRRDLGGAKSGF